MFPSFLLLASCSCSLAQIAHDSSPLCHGYTIASCMVLCLCPTVWPLLPLLSLTSVLCLTLLPYRSNNGCHSHTLLLTTNHLWLDLLHSQLSCCSASPHYGGPYFLCLHLPWWFVAAFHLVPLFCPCPCLLLMINDLWLDLLNSLLSCRSTSPCDVFLHTTCIALCELPPLLYFLLSPSANLGLACFFFCPVK